MLKPRFLGRQARFIICALRSLSNSNRNIHFEANVLKGPLVIRIPKWEGPTCHLSTGVSLLVSIKWSHVSAKCWGEAATARQAQCSGHSNQGSQGAMGHWSLPANRSSVGRVLTPRHPVSVLFLLLVNSHTSYPSCRSSTARAENMDFQSVRILYFTQTEKLADRILQRVQVRSEKINTVLPDEHLFIKKGKRMGTGHELYFYYLVGQVALSSFKSFTPSFLTMFCFVRILGVKFHGKSCWVFN